MHLSQHLDFTIYSPAISSLSFPFQQPEYYLIIPVSGRWSSSTRIITNALYQVFELHRTMIGAVKLADVVVQGCILHFTDSVLNDPLVCLFLDDAHGNSCLTPDRSTRYKRTCYTLFFSLRWSLELQFHNGDRSMVSRLLPATWCPRLGNSKHDEGSLVGRLFIYLFFLELTTFPPTLNTCRVRFNLVSDEPHTSVDELIARSIQNYHSKEGLDALEKILKSAKDIKKHAINDILHAHTLIQGHRDAVFQLGIVR
jgi:hypothetical protein